MKNVSSFFQTITNAWSKHFFIDYYIVSYWAIIKWFKGTLMQIWKSANLFVVLQKQHVQDFTSKLLLLFEICACEICEKFVHKHIRTYEKLAYFVRNLQTSRANNSRILMIKNAKFSGYCFYMNANI